MGTLLDVRSLTTHFVTSAGVVRAVDGVTWDVNAGETVALVGESGCGKSVSALSIMRLVQGPAGRIVDGTMVFKGRDLLKLSEEEMRRVRGREIAMIFQEPMTSLNPVLTIGRQLTEGLEIHLGMTAAAARTRAAACDPGLILADEPTTALDVTIQAQILELMKDLSRRLGVAMLIITHNLGVVARYADRVNVMYAGRIIERGTARDIYTNPRHPYTLGLLASVPRLDEPRRERLAPIEGQPPDLTRLPPGCAFAPRCGYRVERCLVEVPPLSSIGDGGHVAACWEADRVGGRGRRASAESPAAPGAGGSRIIRP